MLGGCALGAADAIRIRFWEARGVASSGVWPIVKDTILYVLFIAGDASMCSFALASIRGHRRLVYARQCYIA